MKAIIVPGVTDLNKGDQALVWESVRLIEDTNLFDNIYILDSGDTDEEKEKLCTQSKKQGFQILTNILPHPRRGKHKKNEHVIESKLELLKQTFYGFSDFIYSLIMLTVCNKLLLAKLLISKNKAQTIKEFKEADAIFVKGGGFIHAYGEKTAPYLMWYFLFYVRLAQKLNKKVIFLPNSFGPFEGFTVKKQVKSVLKKIDIIYARENISADKLGSLLGRKIKVEKDLGFFLEKDEQNNVIEIFEKYNITKEEKIVGITVRPWRFPGFDNPAVLYENYIISMVSLIKYLNEEGYKVVLCNQSLGPNAHEDDRNAIQEVLNRIQSHNIVWINENLDCKSLKTLYSNFDFFIGTRFHSIIFSLTSSIPSIAVAYGGNKAIGIMKDLGLEEYVLSIEKLDFNELKMTFENLVSRKDEIKQRLDYAQIEIFNSRRKIIHNIQELWQN